MKERGSWIDVQGEYNHISIFIPLFLLFINWETGLSCHAMCRIFVVFPHALYGIAVETNIFLQTAHFVITIILTWVEHRMRRIWTLGKRQKAIKHTREILFSCEIWSQCKGKQLSTIGPYWYIGKSWCSVRIDMIMVSFSIVMLQN